MGYGSTNYGAGGWGSGSIIIVPPSEPGPLLSVRVITKTQIILTFQREYVINDDLLDPSNYWIESDGPSSTNIDAVLVEAGNDRASSNSVLLTVQTMTSGVLYTISAQQIIDVNGITVDTLSTISWPFRVTKVQNMLSKLPRHFDLDSESTLRGLVTAIALVDDQIGGNG